MQLQQEFTIPVELERAWQVLLDVEQVAPCFPGAALSSVDGDTVRGTVKVKLGPILLTYDGVLEFVERDDDLHRVAMDARGTDTKGNGSATAHVTAHLSEAGPTTTTCALVTDLNVTGRPAQFGRGMMLEIGNKILGQFSDNLSESLKAPSVAVTPEGTTTGPVSLPGSSTAGDLPAPAAGSPIVENEPLDLLSAARGAALKRLAPVVVAATGAVVLLVWWVNR
jgi:carbon monoxide dehydrogenase subunit G